MKSTVWCFKGFLRNRILNLMKLKSIHLHYSKRQIISRGAKKNFFGYRTTRLFYGLLLRKRPKLRLWVCDSEQTGQQYCGNAFASLTRDTTGERRRTLSIRTDGKFVRKYRRPAQENSTKNTKPTVFSALLLLFSTRSENNDSRRDTPRFPSNRDRVIG